MGSKGWSKGTSYCKRLRINSSNRLNLNDSDTNFTINVGDNLQAVTQVSVVSAQFVNAFYNIFQTNRKYNNWIEVSVDDGKTVTVSQVSIPPGRYSVSTLNAAIITALSSLGPITMSQNTITNLVSMYIAAIPGSVITLRAPTTTPTGAPYNQDYWPLGILGFPSSFVLSQSSGAPSVAINFPVLNQPSIAYITSAALAPTNSFDEEGKTSNVLLPIDINVPYLSLQTFECKIDTLYENNFGKPRPINLIDIQLVDHDGDPLDLHQNPLNLELRVWLNNY